MNIKNIFWIIPVIFLVAFLGTFVSTKTMAKGPAEIRCQAIDWYIGNRLHQKKSVSYEYNDKTVRCENSEVICYIYHGNLSCVKN